MAYNVCANRYASWHMNESSGTNVPDNSGNGRDGTTNGSPTWQAGKINNCLLFNGTSQWVDCGAIAQFDRTDSFSYEFWFKTTSTSTIKIVASTYDGARGLMIYTNVGTLEFDLRGTSSAYLALKTDNTFNDGNWHHAIITYAGTSAPSGVIFYVDGSVETATTVKDTLASSPISTANLTLARRSSGSYWAGNLDEVVIYNRVLTQTEVTGRYNSGAGTENCASATYWFGDSSLERVISGQFTGDASLKALLFCAFEGYADLKKTDIAATFTGDSAIVNTYTGVFTGDADLKRSDISSLFYSDANLVKAVPESFTGNANLKQLLFCAYEGYASLLGTISDTFAGDASIMKADISGSFSSDANLKKAIPNTYTGDANLVGTKSYTFTGDSNLVITSVPGQFTGDAAFAIIHTGSFTGQANLEKMIAGTFKGDCRLMGPGEGQWRGNAYLYDSDLKFLYGPWMYGTIYGGIMGGKLYTTDTFTGDASIGTRHINTYTGDASLAVANIHVIFKGDASLEKYITGSFTGDASFGIMILGSYTGDASLLRISPGVFTGDSFITHPWFTSNANLAGRKYGDFTGDASLFSRYYKTFTADSNLKKELSTAFTGNASLRRGIADTFTGDASLRRIIPLQFTGDSNLASLETQSFTANANLYKTLAAITFTGDSSLKKLQAGQFTSNASLKKIVTGNTFTGDASLETLVFGTFTGNAFFHKEKVTAFAGLPVLESRYQYAAFAGIVDCISNTGLGWGISAMEEFTLDLGI